MSGVHRGIIVQPRYHGPNESLGLQPGVSVEFSLDQPGHLAGVLHLEPIPVVEDSLLPVLGASLGIGVAANLLRSEPSITTITLCLAGRIHRQWREIATLFHHLSGVTFEFETSFSDDPVAGPPGNVFLVSGGKDSLYALIHARKSQCLEGYPAIYLGQGSEINWRNEISQVLRVADYFQVRLQHIRLYQMLVSSKIALRFANRAVWRELVSLSLARCYGNHIFTGINDDAVARLDVTTPRSFDYLSQLIPTVRIMEQILGAKIETVPGEFEVYRDVREHQLFDRSGSCLTPECGFPRLCAKCRTFNIYEMILAGSQLSADDIRFIHSDHFLGDASISSLYPSTVPAMEMKEVSNARQSLL